ncbi:T-complex protein 1 subunit theta-like [Halichondria panicea]|uniref:T-complex protein 1 subunit theta-like n=1 Tax=Halichondria panicea TaxID=6063 RepID=UPI00312B424F
MALSVPKSGLSTMMKDGAKHFHGLEEAIYRNIQACKELSVVTKSSYGPNGMNKMVINHLEKLFVTNDAATVLKELEVQHPAAKMIVMATQTMEQEVGDGTNFVLVLCGALLTHAEELLRMGLSPAEVIDGYEMALLKSLEVLPSLECSKASNLRDKKEVVKALKTSIASMQYGNEDFLAGLVAEACVNALPLNATNFNVDNVRIAKIIGAGVLRSKVMKGMVFRREVEGTLNRMTNAKVAVYTCPFDSMATETKGTVLLKTANELLDFSKTEEDLIEGQVKALSEAGCNVVVAGGKFGEMALHFLNKYNIMAVRLLSKFDLSRLCKSIGATALPKMVPPTSGETGHCDVVEVQEIGDTNVIVFRQEKEESRISTIVVRGSTQNIMDNLERALDDGINTFKALTRDARFVPGAGATEIELAKQLTSYGETCPGLEQYAIKKFAESLESLPRALAENAGVKATEVVSKLYAAHQAGDKNAGVDIEGDGAAVKDMAAAGVWDLYVAKWWGLKLSTTAANTVLRVDQIIMAKQAGGPKPKQNKNWDDD